MDYSRISKQHCCCSLSHASFPAHGSSLLKSINGPATDSKCPYFESLYSRPNTLPQMSGQVSIARLSPCYSDPPLLPSQYASVVERPDLPRRHQHKLQPSFAFPHYFDSPNSLTILDQMDVCSLSCRITFKPVSTRLQHGIRFFHPPNLHTHRFTLQ